MTGFSQRAILKNTGTGSQLLSVPAPAFRFFLILLLMLTTCASMARAQIRYDNYIYEDESFLDRLDDVRVEKTSPFQDVPPDHWAYKAVQRLVDSGLLAGYDDTMFRGDQVVTRYELAMIVAKLLDNYLEWYRTGHVSASEYPTSGYTTPRSSGGAPLRAIEPPDAVISPTARVAVELPSLRSRGISRTTPRIMGEEIGGTEGFINFSDENIQEIKRIARDTVHEEIKFTQKDFDDLAKLVDEFRKELKDINKKFEKDLKGIQKDVQKNTRAIKNLEEENRRFSISGSERFFWLAEGPLTGDGCNDINDPYDRCNMRTTDLFNTLQLDITSKPDPETDLIIGASLIAGTRIGGKRTFKSDKANDPGFDSSGTSQYDYLRQQSAAAYKRSIEGQSTDLSVRDLYIKYNNNLDDPKNPRNFKLRSASFGDFSVLFSPLTVMGKTMQGLTATLQLNDYSFHIFGAREKLHQKTPFFMPDALPDENGFASSWLYNTTYFDEDQYDRYKYGFSLETSLFGNPMARANFTRVYTFDDKDTNFPGCETGKWINLNTSYDAFTFKKPDTDVSTTDLFCMPPEKSSVSSVFVLYPLLENINFMGEYAHSTYYREPFKVLKPYSTFNDCNVNDPGNENSCWWDGRGENQQDDAFIILLNYNKGPITIFPIGYLRLGPEFHADIDLSAFGGGDFDLSSATSILPISIKSLELYVGSFKYEQTNKFSYSTVVADAQEIKPMYFDPGALAVAFSSNSGKDKSLPILNGALWRLNNRTSKLKLKIWTNTYKHYVSDKMSLTIGYTKVNAMLPNSCLDGNIVEVRDELGNLVDKLSGNGITDCVHEDESGDIIFGLKYWMNLQQYTLDWDTSTNTHLKTSMKISDSSLTMKFTPAVEEVVQNLAPKGKYYEFSNEMTYKLSKSTRFKFYYSKTYDRAPDGTDTEEEKYPTRDSDKFLFTVESNF